MERREDLARCIERHLLSRSGGWHVPVHFVGWLRLDMGLLRLVAMALVDYLRTGKAEQRLRFLYGQLSAAEREVFWHNLRQIALWSEITARKEVRDESN